MQCRWTIESLHASLADSNCHPNIHLLQIWNYCRAACMGRAIYLEDNASVVEAALLKNKTHIPEDLTNICINSRTRLQRTHLWWTHAYIQQTQFHSLKLWNIKNCINMYNYMYKLTSNWYHECCVHSESILFIPGTSLVSDVFVSLINNGGGGQYASLLRKVWSKASFFLFRVPINKWCCIFFMTRPVLILFYFVELGNSIVL